MPGLLGAPIEGLWEAGQLSGSVVLAGTLASRICPLHPWLGRQPIMLVLPTFGAWRSVINNNQHGDDDGNCHDGGDQQRQHGPG